MCNVLEFFKCDVHDIISSITACLLALCAIIGVIWYSIISAQNKAKNAMDLIEYYIREIIPQMFFITQVADCKVLLDKINSILEHEDILLFHTDELKKMFDTPCNESIIAQYEHLYDNIAFKRILDTYVQGGYQGKELSYFIKNHVEPYMHDASGSMWSAIPSIERERFAQLMKRILTSAKNSLEYMAIAFLKIGSERQVYSSLHQTYLRYVRFFYINISMHNEAKHEKMNVNTIKLYNIWNAKHKKMRHTYEKRTIYNQKLLSRQ